MSDEQDHGFGERLDGTKKGLGFFGKLQRLDDPQSFSTELSADVDIDGKKLFFPLLVPTLSREEIDHLLKGAPPNDAIYGKALSYAQDRLKQGKNPFASQGEQMPVPSHSLDPFKQGFDQEARRR